MHGRFSHRRLVLPWRHKIPVGRAFDCAEGPFTDLIDLIAGFGPLGVSAENEEDVTYCSLTKSDSQRLTTISLDARAVRGADMVQTFANRQEPAEPVGLVGRSALSLFGDRDKYLLEQGEKNTIQAAYLVAGDLLSHDEWGNAERVTVTRWKRSIFVPLWLKPQEGTVEVSGRQYPRQLVTRDNSRFVLVRPGSLGPHQDQPVYIQDAPISKAQWKEMIGEVKLDNTLAPLKEGWRGQPWLDLLLFFVNRRPLAKSKQQLGNWFDELQDDDLKTEVSLSELFSRLKPSDFPDHQLAIFVASRAEAFLQDMGFGHQEVPETSPDHGVSVENDVVSWNRRLLSREINAFLIRRDNSPMTFVRKSDWEDLYFPWLKSGYESEQGPIWVVRLLSSSELGKLAAGSSGIKQKYPERLAVKSDLLDRVHAEGGGALIYGLQEGVSTWLKDEKFRKNPNTWVLMKLREQEDAPSESRRVAADVGLRLALVPPRLDDPNADIEVSRKEQ